MILLVVLIVLVDDCLFVIYVIVVTNIRKNLQMLFSGKNFKGCNHE